MICDSFRVHKKVSRISTCNLAYLDDQDSNLVRITEAHGEATRRSGQGGGGDRTAFTSQGWQIVDTRGTWGSQSD